MDLYVEDLQSTPKRQRLSHQLVQRPSSIPVKIALLGRSKPGYVKLLTSTGSSKFPGPPSNFSTSVRAKVAISPNAINYMRR